MILIKQGAAMGNLFSPLPTQLPEEVSQMLVNSASVRIERVVSHGHASPVGFWYEIPSFPIAATCNNRQLVPLNMADDVLARACNV